MEQGDKQYITEKWIEKKQIEYNLLLEQARDSLKELDDDQHAQKRALNAQISLYHRFLDDIENLQIKLSK